MNNSIWIVCSNDKCNVKEFVAETKLQEHTICLACKARMVFAVDYMKGNNNFVEPTKHLKELEEIKTFEQSDLKRISRSEIIDWVINLNLKTFDELLGVK